MSKKDELLKLCEQFIATHDIYCAEKIYQTDRIIENAYEFIEDICDIVGYVKDESEE